MKRELTKKDISIVAAAMVALAVVLGTGFFASQKANANAEVARMQTQMKREMGRNPEMNNDGPVEAEDQSDPHFQP